MKKLIILTLTVIAMYSCKRPIKMYHVKIDCWRGNDQFGSNFYSIYFTNSDGIIWTSIKDGADLPYVWDLHGDTSALIKMANRFKTYKDCIYYNDSVENLHDSLFSPPKVIAKTTDTIKCCSAKQIY